MVRLWTISRPIKLSIEFCVYEDPEEEENFRI